MVNVMLKQQIQEALRNFIAMLNSTFEDVSENLSENIMAMAQHVRGLLAEGEVASQSLNGYTPLMLYSCFNITDDRFQKELKRGKEYISQMVDYNIDEQPRIKISALSFAAAMGSIEALTILYKTGCFTTEHMGEAAYLAASQGKEQSIAFFRDRKVNLFKPLFFARLTPLHIACVNGFSEVVTKILDSNPSEEELNMPTFGEDAKIAYELAVENDRTECAKLLRNYRSSVWTHIRKAISADDKDSLISLLNEHGQLDLSINVSPRNDESLIGLAAFEADLYARPNSNEIYTIAENYIDTLSAEKQINSLLVGISQVMMPFLSGTSAPGSPQDENNVFYYKMMEKLKGLEPHFPSLSCLRFNGLRLNEDLWTIIKNILITSPIQKLELVYSCYQSFDIVTGDASSFNIQPNLTSEFVARLLSNTTLINCQLLSDTSHEPIVSLLSKIIERNQKIAEAKLEIIKDKIYNHYVLEINKLIDEIKTNPNIGDAQCLSSLDKSEAVYPLKHLTAFFIANKTDLDTSAMTLDCNELVALATIPKLL